MTVDFELLLLGNPQLRQLSNPIEDVSSTELQNFIADLFVFVEQRNGVGIAAPQVGHPIQMFIMVSKPNERYPHAPVIEPTVMINPVILAHSETMTKDWEGCLSVPGLRGLVPRYDSIEVQFQTQFGEIITTSYDGFLARVFQHELDHLQGKLYVDHVESTLDLMVEAEWRRQILGEKT